MYLFQLNAIWTPSDFFLIYIPLCIYFNRSKSGNPFSNTHIYIPLSIYFNGTRCLSSIEYPRFTFHYVSISTITPCCDRGGKHHLHSTMYLFQRYSAPGTLKVPVWFTFHYVSISTMSILIICVSTVLIYIPLCIYFNHEAVHGNIPTFINLHSTMYLFQL